MSKNQILGSETSKKHNLQKWTPFRSRSPQSKVMSIILKFSRDQILASQNFKTGNWSKNKILGSETSENITSKNELISLWEPLIKNYEHFIEIDP